MLKVFVGYDRREVAAYQVCVASLIGRASIRLDIAPLLEPDGGMSGKALVKAAITAFAERGG